MTRDIASFPTISSSYAITLVFNPGVAALGNALILLTPINCADLPGNCNTDAYYINPIKRLVPPSMQMNLLFIFQNYLDFIFVTDDKCEMYSISGQSE